MILEDELRCMKKAEYHLNIFKQCAAHYGVSLPCIRYNANGAFVGEVVAGDDTFPLPSYGSPDTQTMLNDAFLAAPFLDLSSHQELHFTNNKGAECRYDDEIDTMDLVLAAFTHSCLVDSDYTVMVTDIQVFILKTANWSSMTHKYTHIVLANWDHNDEGWRLINSFLREHRCNKYCCKLQLEGASPASLSPRPLKHHGETPELKEGKEGNNQVEPRPVLPPLHSIYTVDPMASVSMPAPVLVPLASVTRRGKGPLRIGFSPTK
ncbi:hypothetical protein M422DRAFT_243034 [Sphaerobolus stellatus SS14]|nr:hypothetical protein M422DRAFT_243034 [Sphaerobolus stellatus SS14]